MGSDHAVQCSRAIMMPVPQGHYAQRQLGSRLAVVRWSHAARFRQAVALTEGRHGEKLLDYGCGDGTFIGLVAGTFISCVGADISADQVEDCESRFAEVPNVTFCLVPELAGDQHSRQYGIVTCMETLEHCLERTVEVVLADLNRLCAPNGTVVISVPIETGPAFLMKYFGRKFAAWRGLREYGTYETYSPRDAVRMLFASEGTVVDRPVYGGPESPYHSHYGFNWRQLRMKIAQVFGIERTLFSPLRFSGGWFSSQVWFVCRPRP
jgi:2-polyprenyl-3-methyl-5-hydroxy-6-metoxy-1,4-benzoquinol methylase